MHHESDGWKTVLKGKIRAGVIGGGRWGRNIIRTLVGLGASGSVEVVCVVDHGLPEPAEFIRKNFSLSCETGIDRLWASSPDVVFIATPDATHYALASESLERGIHTFVEKPLAMSLAEANRLVDLAHRKNVVLSTGHLLVFHPALQMIRDHLAGKGQRPTAFFSSRLGQFPLAGGKSVVRSSLIHDLAMLDVFLPSEPSDVTAVAMTHTSGGPGHVDILMRYSDDVRAHVIGSSVWPEDERIFAIWSENYFYHFDGRKNVLKIFYTRQQEAGAYTLESEQTVSAQTLSLEIANVLSALDDPSRLVIGSDHIRRVLSTVDRIELALSGNQNTKKGC